MYKSYIKKAGHLKGRLSLYLDYYPAIRNPFTMKLTRREFLGIYIYKNPKTQIEKEYNREVMNKAEGIRAIRVQSLINDQFGFLDKHKLKADFLDYFYKIALKKIKSG